MCRFAAYFGHSEILLGDILDKPENSLIKQSHASKEAMYGMPGVHADGFGLAWYHFAISDLPGVFKSMQPAWSDQNLMHLSQKIQSSCFLTHVRASTIGDVNQHNCHPFTYGAYAMVHNGTIRNFARYKRKMVAMLDDDLFLSIKGNTDSECLFFLIMQWMRSGLNMVDAVLKAIRFVEDLQKKDEDGFSRLNIVITNGKELMATRFVSKSETSLSLRYFLKQDAASKVASLIISSEPLHNDAHLWQSLPNQHYLYLHRDHMQLQLGRID